jgi:hypothetical protein
MPLPTVEFAYEGTIYSPFSGLPADSEEEGPNENDPTLLFTYYGGASTYGYVSPRLANILEDEWEDEHPLDIAPGLHIEGGLIVSVDASWNGVNCYGFAPAESEVSYKPQQ